MLDKIPMPAKGEVLSDYHANFEKGLDQKCAKFLRVNYDQPVEGIQQGGSDEEILEWRFTGGRKPSEDDVYVWNEFVRKRGWNDEVSEVLERARGNRE
jgi:gluconokinase